MSICVTTTTMDIATLIFILYHILTHLHQFSLIVTRITQLAPFFVFFDTDNLNCTNFIDTKVRMV